MAKKDSPYRTATIDENLRLWKEMQKGSEEGLKCCVRAKIDMQSNNGALRDPATFRCNLTPHHQTKDKYKVYPTYDLACPIVDALEGVTHALRDRQYSDRDAQYEWFLTNLKLRKVHLWGFSRINFVRTLLSKRELRRNTSYSVLIVPYALEQLYCRNMSQRRISDYSALIFQIL